MTAPRLLHGAARSITPRLKTGVPMAYLSRLSSRLALRSLGAGECAPFHRLAALGILAIALAACERATAP